MFIMIVGGGRLGSFLAGLMEEKSEKVIVIEKDESKAEKLRKELKCPVMVGDGCNPDILRKSGILETEIVVALTGHDEDNLIVCQLAKFEFGVSKVISKINNPKNEWLFAKDMGVDAAVSGARTIAKLIEEEAEISSITTILNLAEGKISLAKSVIEKNSKAASKQIKELDLPEGCVIMAIIRDSKVLLPNGKTSIQPDDEIFTVVSEESKEELEKLFGE